MKARIGMDVHSTTGELTGIGRYTQGLAQELKRHQGQFDFVWLTRAQEDALNVPRRLWWENVGLPRAAARANVDLLHCPGFAPPAIRWRRRYRLILTVHDLIGMRFPQHLAPVSRWYWSQWLPWAASRADRIIADSEATQRDLIELLHVEARRIRVIYPGIESWFRPVLNAEAIRAVKRRYQIAEDGHYLLHVGTIEPRKNLARLVEAFAAVAGRDGMSDLTLVLAGGAGWALDQVREVATRCQVERAVRFIGYVADSNLPALYSGARGVLMPSLYEGFGYPALEAMACGVPVAVSRASSLPEIVGEDGLYFDPASVAEMVEAMTRLLQDETLGQTLGQRGLTRSQRFHWSVSSSAMITAYLDLLGSAGGS